MKHRWLAGLFAPLILLCQCATAAPHAGGLATQAAFEERVDELVRDGYERAAGSVASLQGLLAQAQDGDDQRQLLQALGAVQAQAGQGSAALAQAARLQALATLRPGSLAAASAQLVQAMVAESGGQMEQAAGLAQAALARFAAHCEADPAAPVAIDDERCEYRSAWRALQVLQRRAMSQGLPVVEAAHAQAALVLAERGDDARRQSTNLVALSLLAQGRGEAGLSDQLIAKARRLGNVDAAQQAKLLDVEARLDAMRGEHTVALRHLAAAREMAAAAGAPRLEARMWTNLSDAYARLGRPLDALRAAERALPVVRRNHDLATEWVLVNNAGIAKIGLGRVAEGKADLLHLLAIWRSGGETGRQVETLREFGEALALAGDARSAADLFHQEQALSAQLMNANRDLALKGLRARNDAEARQRDILALSRDNADKGAALAEREVLQRIFWLLACLMALATAVVALLYRRVRQTHARLAFNHGQLKLMSERDPLTGLANRRHFHSVMNAMPTGRGFEGALLLVDVDHFKRINDDCGHAAGDEVLVEVARRLAEAAQQDDLVVRWGGEEFLLLAPQVDAEQALQIAERVRHALSGRPVNVGLQRLQITASIGCGRFPLAAGADAGAGAGAGRLSWEQALHLVDVALYAAKEQGRNRVVAAALPPAPQAGEPAVASDRAVRLHVHRVERV